MYSELSLKSIVLILSLSFLSVCRSYSQGYDADSVFLNDPQASEFFENFDYSELDNPPGWDRILTYKDLAWIELTLSIYDGKNADPLHPCLVFFHGGGWETRALNQYKQYAYYFSKLGFTSAIVKYRVFNDSSVVEPCDEIKDAKSAIRYIREHADILKVDTTRIVAVGMSAGGHLASATAFIDTCEENIENIDISSVPNALMLQNPVIDLSEEGWEDGHDYLGETWTDLSPLHNLDIVCKSVPSIIMSGTSDRLTPISGMIKWGSNCESLDCFSRLYVFEGRGHAFANYSEARSGEGHRDFIYCVYFMESFLRDIGFCTHGPGLSTRSETVNDVKFYLSNDRIHIHSKKLIQQIRIYSMTGNIEKIIELKSHYANIEKPEIQSGVKLIRIIYGNGRTESRLFI